MECYLNNHYIVWQIVQKHSCKHGEDFCPTYEATPSRSIDKVNDLRTVLVLLCEAERQ